MTVVERMFYFVTPPGPAESQALGQIREVYGIRRISLILDQHAIQVEFDVSRLTEDDVAALLRDASIQLLGRASAS